MGLIKITGGGIIEKVGGLLNGQTVKTANGDITLGNVTVENRLGTSYEDPGGGSITYTAPTGTKQVLVEYLFMAHPEDGADTISHWKMDIDGTEITDARAGFGSYRDTYFRYAFTIQCNAATESIANGQLAGWTTAKTINITARSYNTTYDQDVHATRYWDGTSGTHFHRPSLFLTALS